MSGHRLAPMEHTGDSANIAFYRERGTPATRPDHIWCEVLRNDIVSYRDPAGERRLKKRPIPLFSVRVYRSGKGQIAEFTYEPKTRPRAGALPSSTVTRLARDALVSSLASDPTKE